MHCSCLLQSIGHSSGDRCSHTNTTTPTTKLTKQRGRIQQRRVRLTAAFALVAAIIPIFLVHVVRRGMAHCGWWGGCLRLPAITANGLNVWRVTGRTGWPKSAGPSVQCGTRGVQLAHSSSNGTQSVLVAAMWMAPHCAVYPRPHADAYASGERISLSDMCVCECECAPLAEPRTLSRTHSLCLRLFPFGNTEST